MPIAGRRVGLWPAASRSLGAAALGILLATAAQAEIVETSTIHNEYAYGFNGALTAGITAGPDEHLRIDNSSNGFVSEFGLDLTTSLDNGNFDFLHNAYCVGNCRISSITEIVFTLTNTGDTAEQVRFDSLITPGHLAAFGLADVTAIQADYSFNVFQTADPDGTVLDGTALYSATGVINPDRSSISAFNGVQHDDNGSTWQVYDWSATNLNLVLATIAPGETQYLHYLATVNAQSNADCTDLSDCAGTQVAFGDPRNNGSVTSTSLFAAMRDLDDPTQPVIGRQYGAYTSSAAFVAPDAALPDTPPVLPPVTYGAPFESQAVPEPSSWAMLLAGFTLIGGAMRRRGASRPTLHA